MTACCTYMPCTYMPWPARPYQILSLSASSITCITLPHSPLHHPLPYSHSDSASHRRGPVYDAVVCPCPCLHTVVTLLSYDVVPLMTCDERVIICHNMASDARQPSSALHLRLISVISTISVGIWLLPGHSYDRAHCSRWRHCESLSDGGLPSNINHTPSPTLP